MNKADGRLAIETREIEALFGRRSTVRVPPNRRSNRRKVGQGDSVVEEERGDFRSQKSNRRDSPGAWEICPD